MQAKGQAAIQKDRHSQRRQPSRTGAALPLHYVRDQEAGTDGEDQGAA